MTTVYQQNYQLRKQLKKLEPIVKAYREHRHLITVMRNNSKTLQTNWISDFYKGKNFTQCKLSYLTGIIDGEGYLKFEKNGTVRLIVGMTDKKTIKWIHKNFGGTFNEDQKLKSGKSFYVWRMNQGKNLYYLLLHLLPFLITKKSVVYKGLLEMIRRMNDLEFTLKSYSDQEV